MCKKETLRCGKVETCRLPCTRYNSSSFSVELRQQQLSNLSSARLLSQLWWEPPQVLALDMSVCESWPGKVRLTVLDVSCVPLYDFKVSGVEHP